MNKRPFDVEECICKGPLSELERLYMGEYLRSRGYHWEDLHKLPAEEEKMLMTEACNYTSLKLAELDARAQFMQEIHTPF